VVESGKGSPVQVNSKKRKILSPIVQLDGPAEREDSSEFQDEDIILDPVESDPPDSLDSLFEPEDPDPQDSVQEPTQPDPQRAEDSVLEPEEPKLLTSNVEPNQASLSTATVPDFGLDLNRFGYPLQGTFDRTPYFKFCTDSNCSLCNLHEKIKPLNHACTTSKVDRWGCEHAVHWHERTKLCVVENHYTRVVCNPPDSKEP
jgi:hypothetical protein